MRKAVAWSAAAGALLSLLSIPPGLEARARKGAAVIIVLSDAKRSVGELIAVRSDSLLLLRDGQVFTIPRLKVGSVLILRRSKMPRGALTGALIGAAAGVAWGVSYGDSGVHGIRTPVKAGYCCGILGLVIGLAASPGEKVEASIVLAGTRTWEADDCWNALRPYSREVRRSRAARQPRHPAS